MKVLMTADTVGGVWTYAIDLIRSLAEHDVQVALATMGAPLTQDQRDEAAELHNLELHESSYRLEWMEDPWEDVAAAGSWLLELANVWKPDLVHLNEYVHGANRWGVPAIVVGHSCVCSWFEGVRGELAGPEWNVYRRLVRYGLGGADLVVAPSYVMLQMLQKHYGPLNATRVIHNGRSAPAAGTCEKEPFVFAAGRLWDEAKNIRALAQIAPALAWPIQIAGLPHPEKSDISFDSLVPLGRLSSTQMREVFARASIYALPARYEPFGLTPLEAALAGCALVLGDIPTLREVWGEAARYVSPDDLKGLTRAIQNLIDHEELRRDQATRALRRARELSAERMAADYFAVYRRLTNNRRWRLSSLQQEVA